MPASCFPKRKGHSSTRLDRREKILQCRKITTPRIVKWLIDKVSQPNRNWKYGYQTPTQSPDSWLTKWKLKKKKKGGCRWRAPYKVSKLGQCITPWKLSRGWPDSTFQALSMVSRAWSISAFKSSKSSTPKLNRTRLSLIPYFSLSDRLRSLFSNPRGGWVDNMTEVDA